MQRLEHVPKTGIIRFVITPSRCMAGLVLTMPSRATGWAFVVLRDSFRKVDTIFLSTILYLHRG